MFKVEKVIDARGQTLIQDPPIARFFFQSTVTSVLWLAVRLYVGYAFLIAGWHKFTTPAWMDGSGTGILGFLLILAWKNAGYIGLDYFMLPMLGTPWWKPGKVSTSATPLRTPAAVTR